MNPRTLRVLEYTKVLERVAAYCSFSGGEELARALLPSDDLETVRDRLAETAEASRLLEQRTEVSFGGVRDVRPFLEKAERGAMLFAQDLLEIRGTLMRARTLQNMFLRLEQSFPRLAGIAVNIQPCSHIIDEIGRCINDRAEVADGASDALGRVRQELRVAQERLLSTLDRIVHSADIKPHLQEALVTQRQGRYVIPIRADAKGQVEASSTTSRLARDAVCGTAQGRAETTPYANWSFRKSARFVASSPS